jgi:predicted RNA-binding protein
MSMQRRFLEMCEANAFILRNGEEKLLLESVDLVEPEEEGQIRLVNIFGEQKIIKGKLKSMNLVNHKILFEE